MDQVKVLRKISERHSGKITCECGNKNWEQFLYIGDLPDGDYRIACKKCGEIQKYEEENSTRQSTNNSTHS